MFALFTMSTIASTLIWGVALGCIYILLATGLNVIFGVMKLVNFAHGQFLMIGAYISFTFLVAFGLNPYIGVFVAMALIVPIGIAVERLTFRKVLGTEKLNEIFISLGLIYIFENVATLLWSEKGGRTIESPFKNMGLPIGDASISYDYIIAIIFAAIILVGLVLLVKKTKIGLAMRATSQKNDTAMLMGINVERIYIFTFALGTALAAAAGALYGIMFSFSPTFGAIPTIKAFAIIILGGLGSIPGAIVGGLLYGIAEQTTSLFFQSTWADAVAFIVLIVVLVLRPTGLFGKKGE